MKIYTAHSECDEIIGCFDTIEDAIKAIESYEEDDKKYGDYTPGRYEIMDENYGVYEITHEAIVIQSLENINEYKNLLLSNLMFVFALTDPTYPNKDSEENLIMYRKGYERLSMHLKKLSDETYERIIIWKQICTTDEQKRIQKYSDEITVLNADIKYFDKLYNEQISPIKTA